MQRSASFLCLLLLLTLVGTSPVSALDDWDGGQVAYVKASNPDILDFFGNAVALDGNTLVVGSPGEDSAAPGVGGDQADNSLGQTGAVYVYVRVKGAWIQQAYLKASHPGLSDNFGSSLALSGDTLVVGAAGDDSGSAGVGGDPADNSLWNAGAVTVFVRSGETWSQQAYLKPLDPEAGRLFGRSVAIDGERIVVGAPYDVVLQPGLPGAAYVFARRGTTWSEEVRLTASNASNSDEFGQSVGISGQTVVVGAPDERSAAVGVDGDQGDTGAPLSGAAYVFALRGGVWSQQAYVKAINTDSQDAFGRAVAISGETLVVGAQHEDSQAVGVDGDPFDEYPNLGNAGAAYVYERSGTTWTSQAYLKATNTDARDWFGGAVAIDGDLILVGAHLEDGRSSGIDGDGASNGAPGAGAAYLYARGASGWVPAAYIKAGNSQAGDGFGGAVAVSRGSLAVGARVEDSAATGVNGNAGDNSINAAGAAYVFADVSPWEDLGFALAGVSGEPRLDGKGTLAPSTPVSVLLADAATNAPAFLCLGFAALGPAPLLGGQLVPDVFTPPGQVLVLVTDASGAVDLSGTWPAAMPSGFEIFLQSWIADAAGPFGYAASNAIRGTTP